MLYHLIVYAPVAAAAAIRSALTAAGAGAIGNYDGCSFSCRGTGRFRGNERACPAAGKPGRVEEVAEERIEVVVEKAKLVDVLRGVVAVLLYEAPAIHVLPMENYKAFL